MAEGERRSDSGRLVIESTRVRRAAATVDRIERPRRESWTGELRLEPGELGDSGLIATGQAGPRVEAVVPPRRRGKVESVLRLAVAVGLLLVVLAFFGEALLSLFSEELRPWRAVPLRVTSDPPGATVYIGDRPRGTTPLEDAVPCRGRSLRLRLVKSGYASWLWDGPCPERGALRLQADLQRR